MMSGGGFGRHGWVVLGGGFAERESGGLWYWGEWSQRVKFDPGVYIKSGGRVYWRDKVIGLGCIGFEFWFWFY